MEENKQQSEVSMQNGMPTSSQRPPKSNMLIWYFVGGFVCLVFVTLLLLAFNKSQPVYNPPSTVTQTQPTLTPTPSITESQAVDDIKVEDATNDINDLTNDVSQL